MVPKSVPKVNSNYRRLRRRLHLEDDTSSLTPVQQWNGLANYCVFSMKKVMPIIKDDELRNVYKTIINAIVSEVHAEDTVDQKMKYASDLAARGLLVKFHDESRAVREFESGVKEPRSQLDRQVDLVHAVLVEISHLDCKRPSSVYDIYTAILRNA